MDSRGGDTGAGDRRLDGTDRAGSNLDTPSRESQRTDENSSNRIHEDDPPDGENLSNRIHEDDPPDPPDGEAASPSDGADGVASAIGVVAASVALAGTAGPLQEADDPAVFVGTGAAIVAIVAFLLARYGLARRVHTGPVAAIAAAVVAVYATYGLNHGLTAEWTVAGLGSVPTLFVALVAACVGVGAGAADYAALSWEGLYHRIRATLAYSGVGLAGFVSMTVWGVIVAGLVVPLAVGVAWGELSQELQTLFSQVVLVLGLGTVAAAVLVLTDRGWSFIDLKLPTTRDLIYVVGGFALLVGAAMAISLLLRETGTESAGHGSMERAAEHPEILLILIPASILVIGPFEELLYRNVIQKSLYEYFSKSGAVIVASIPFAIVHFPAYSGGHLGQSLVSLGVVLTLSIILGALYARTENLVVPALVHGCYNALVFYNQYVSLVN